MRKLKNEELGRKTLTEYKQSEKVPLIVVLDNVRSLNNIGSIFRTADAFSIQAIYLCGITAIPPHREIQKTALGATESVSWKYFDSTFEAIMELKKLKYRIVVIEQTENSISLHNYVPNKQDNIAIIFGHEVNGVEQAVVNISDVHIEIPQFGTKHSLNIAVSAGIVIWDLFWKMNKNN